MEDKIIIRGAKENNLKDVNLVIPRNKFVVFTGLSGSGKSSFHEQTARIHSCLLCRAIRSRARSHSCAAGTINAAHQKRPLSEPFFIS